MTVGMRRGTVILRAVRQIRLECWKQRADKLMCRRINLAIAIDDGSKAETAFWSWLGSDLHDGVDLLSSCREGPC